MAITRKLTCKFRDSEGAQKSISFAYVGSEITQQQVSTLMDAIITNTSIYANTFVSKISAELQVIDTSTLYPSE